MNSPETHASFDFAALARHHSRPSRWLRQLSYQAWREAEIVRLELSITRSVASRTRLLRVHRTVRVDEMLFVNERRLLRLGSALSALTRIPFSLVDLLAAAAAAPRFEMR